MLLLGQVLGLEAHQDNAESPFGSATEEQIVSFESFQMYYFKVFSSKSKE